VAVPFYLVDVFAERPLEGNPLALVAQAELLDETLLPRIAREFNQSETTFLLPSTRGATWRLRSFTPEGAEVFGAGHNALGAWWWLAVAGRLELDRGAGRFTQELGARVLPVEVVAGDGGRPQAISIEQGAPRFGRPTARRAAIAGALGLAEPDLRTDLPVQVVDTGAAHLLVPVADRRAVDRAEPDRATLLEALRSLGGEGCYVYALDPPEQVTTAYARFFNPTVGISEDPATGSAAGPLACQLVANGLLYAGTPAVVEQGTAMGRRSRIRVDVSGELVRISGAGVVVAEGILDV
jgi:PhzF family phenazine biosynthesis protein